MESFKSYVGSVPNFPYQGSKFSIRNWVLSFMPKQGNIYVEPFVGRGNMFFLAKSHLNFKEWHINDLNTSKFFNAIQNVDLSQLPDEMTKDKFRQYKNNPDDLSTVMEPDVAHKGHYRAGFSGSYGRNRKYSKEFLSQKISSARGMLQNVNITNLEWDRLPLRKYKSQDFIYFDSPYLDTDNRYYKDAFDHEKYLMTVKSLSARWLLSHSYHDFYVSELGQPFAVKNRKTAKNFSGEQLTECLWKNY